MSDRENADSAATAAPGENEASLPARLISRLRERFRARSDSLRESLEEVIDEHQDASADFTPVERMMLANIMRIGQLRLDDVMVPRADIVAVEVNSGPEELIKTFNSAGHSRLPLYRDTLDDPVGMVHIKDLMRRWSQDGIDKQPKFSLLEIRRELMFVPPSMRAVDLLLKMRVTRIHMALVIDEYGGTDGLITIEDLVEEIVGEIRDEHDEDGPRLTPRPDGGFDADGRVEVCDLEKATGLSLVPDDKEYYTDTLGGLVTSLTGRVPQRGELIAHPDGLEFEILEADARSVKRLRVHFSRPPDNCDNQETAAK
ncbi:MAG: hemolysin family protein [Alphaproteobacteria bacterium]